MVLKATLVSQSTFLQQIILSMLQEETGPTMSFPSLQYQTQASLSRVPSLISQKLAKGPALQFFFFSSTSFLSSGLPISKICFCFTSLDAFFLFQVLGSMQKSLGSYRFSAIFSGVCDQSEKSPRIQCKGVMNLRAFLSVGSKRVRSSEYPIDAISTFHNYYKIQQAQNKRITQFKYNKPHDARKIIGQKAIHI